MTPQEIINEIQKLPLEQKKEVINSISEDFQPTITEDEFEQMLFAKGIISNIPNLDEYTDEDEDFEPIDVEGEPLSEMIIRERR